MAKKNKQGKKLKESLSNIIRKQFSQSPGSVLTHKQVCTSLDIRENSLRRLAFTVLEELVREQFLRHAAYGQYVLNESGNFVDGYLQMTARGSGFVIPDDDQLADVFIPPHAIAQSLDGDRVRVQLTKKGKNRNEGRIVEVTERERTQFVGTIELHDKFAFLVPDNSKVGTDIFIPLEKLKGARHKDKALVRITAWPKSAENPYGEVVEVLGSSNTNDIEMLGILVNQGIDYAFPDEVLTQAEAISIDLDQEEVKIRRDFRDLITFTIDPDDAKDFDDALSIRHLGEGKWEIGVHIADVSHYVPLNSPMDQEAYKRSNSVYLADRVIPMLPEQLSNLACSLRPKEDKFTFSALFEMDEKGRISKEWFGKGVIHSKRRFAYEEAQVILEGADGDYADELHTLDKIAKTLRKERLKKGAMNIESEEVRFRFDADGHPSELIIKRSKDAHKLIEEFMLLANRRVATHVSEKKWNGNKVPFVYRCHDKPDPDRIGLFSLFVAKFGYEVDLSDERNIANGINALLDDIRYKNEYSIIQNMAIRSMAKASYEAVNIGHFGLAFEQYTHFTSPIRRYADLVVHRILQDVLLSDKLTYGSNLPEICKRISRMERKAIEAERESTKYFQALFVVDQIGQEFMGAVSGIAEFGIFVRMNENQCEGLVPMSGIPGDRFYFDQQRFVVVGSKTKKEYNIGDEVRVRIYEVSTRKRQIDLELIA